MTEEPNWVTKYNGIDSNGNVGGKKIPLQIPEKINVVMTEEENKDYTIQELIEKDNKIKELEAENKKAKELIAIALDYGYCLHSNFRTLFLEFLSK